MSHLVKLSLPNICPGDATERGFQMFCRMFKNQPATQQLFTFAAGQAGDQMRASGKLLFHVSRVVRY